jgi:hypothetical protein
MYCTCRKSEQKWACGEPKSFVRCMNTIPSWKRHEVQAQNKRTSLVGYSGENKRRQYELWGCFCYLDTATCKTDRPLPIHVHGKIDGGAREQEAEDVEMRALACMRRFNCRAVNLASKSARGWFFTLAALSPGPRRARAREKWQLKSCAWICFNQTLGSRIRTALAPKSTWWL